MIKENTNYKLVPKEFKPNIFHILYIIRTCLLEKINLHKHHLKGRMMDFGCGKKPYQSLFNVDEYIGVDFDGEGHSHKDEQIDVFYDGKHLPFPDNHFDSVFSSEVFEHVFNLEEIVLEIKRTMKKGGIIMITCPFVWYEHEIPNDYARYTQFALKHLFEKSGFEVIKIDKTGNATLSIFQLIHFYFSPKILSFIFTPLINIVALGVNKLIKSKKTLYLNNIVIAKKI